jgi:hypothetical protein
MNNATRVELPQNADPLIIAILSVCAVLGLFVLFVLMLLVCRNRKCTSMSTKVTVMNQDQC